MFYPLLITLKDCNVKTWSVMGNLDAVRNIIFEGRAFMKCFIVCRTVGWLSRLLAKYLAFCSFDGNNEASVSGVVSS